MFLQVCPSLSIYKKNGSSGVTACIFKVYFTLMIIDEEEDWFQGQIACSMVSINPRKLPRQLLQVVGSRGPVPSFRLIVLSQCNFVDLGDP